jgi:hypothetical protein
VSNGNIEYVVETTHDVEAQEITQEIVLSDADGIRETVWRGVLSVQEQQITAALIDLGWMPPKQSIVGGKFTDDLKYHLWRMYQDGRGSADHTAREVFDQMLDSLAKWLKTP